MKLIVRGRGGERDILPNILRSVQAAQEQIKEGQSDSALQILLGIEQDLSLLSETEGVDA